MDSVINYWINCAHHSAHSLKGVQINDCFLIFHAFILIAQLLMYKAP